MTMLLGYFKVLDSTGRAIWHGPAADGQAALSRCALILGRLNDQRTAVAITEGEFYTVFNAPREVSQ